MALYCFDLCIITKRHDMKTHKTSLWVAMVVTVPIAIGLASCQPQQKENQATSTARWKQRNIIPRRAPLMVVDMPRIVSLP